MLIIDPTANMITNDGKTYAHPKEPKLGKNSRFPILVSFHKDTNTSPSTPLLDDGINIDISPPSPFSLYE